MCRDRFEQVQRLRYLSLFIQAARFYSVVQPFACSLDMF
jgi:hypothetical protein